MADTKITRDLTIEDLVYLEESAVTFLLEKKIRCIRCGEPIWDTIEVAAREAGYSEEEIDGLVEDLNALSD